MSSLSVKYMAMNSKICILILYKGRFLANDSKLELKMEKIETRCTPPTTHEYTFKISSDFKHNWVRSHASREARQANHANSPIFRCKCAVYWGVQIGISYYFIFAMKLPPNSNIFVLSMSPEMKDTCHNCQILSKLKFCKNY